MFYLIPFSENVFVYFLNSAERIILNLFEYVPYTIRDYKKDLTFSETFKKSILCSGSVCMCIEPQPANLTLGNQPQSCN